METAGYALISQRGYSTAVVQSLPSIDFDLESRFD